MVITNASNSGTLTPSSYSTGKSYTFDPNWSVGAGTTSIQSALRVSGDAIIEGELTVSGRSIGESLRKIEEHLGILVPNSKLEADWEELRQLRMQYVELERELLEKQRTFDILKK